MKIGEKIKFYRNKRDLTISECANFVGVSQSTFRDWENGRSINGEPYLKISDILGIPLTELFGLKSNEVNKTLEHIEMDLIHIRNHVKTLRSRL